MLPPQEEATQPFQKCTVDGCEKPQDVKGYCVAHYKKVLRYGDPLAGPGKGSPGKPKPYMETDRRRMINNHGYALIRVAPSKWVMEHRYVMEQRLGRPLEKDERIHHKDGNRLNNTPENLELWLHSHPSGQRMEDIVAWAKEILQRYGE